ncbi:carbohydrate ABC transporter permease [Actinacidiphila guanduensis]|jgi:multiple sugar transport system permease protein|uniref:Carbohydrate ABC transporter membrane protein 1, CUT1 family n=1 Tax=Actinacidiphila guanduensis TaxID=310781 RepID=A0A1H0MWJ4_9ACTN|nr:sugar ABC transporter permease [Actinacidiphila guanduensis]SDO84656.1 carbohydrate ABC transporter membrane protein 1, CUT1 family [Actinacidiphila guanduensis]
MTLLATRQVTASAPRRGSRPRRWGRGSAGWFFVAGYAVLLLAFGVFPTCYAFYLAFTNSAGQFTGFNQFTKVVRDYRFGPAFSHVLLYLVLWLVTLVVLTVLAAVLLRSRVRPGLSALLRFLYYIPGALAGVASVLVWLFMLDPDVSPVSWLLDRLGLHTFAAVLAPGNLPVIFMLIAFWTGAGGWMVVMYGALNNIPDEVIEAARMDGAGPWRTAWHIQIPMIRQWIAYMTILAFAGGTQLFVEPQLLQTASLGRVSPAWSPNQLAYVYAFQQGDFNGAAAISVFLLALGLICAGLLVARSNMFTLDET